MPVTVYVLKSSTTGKRYVGITANLASRLRQHARGLTRGGQLLGAFALVHTEELPDFRTAREREKLLESGQGRKWLDEMEATSGATGGD
jgi:predicted GIY-YIG superfamily endonuclease